MSSEFFPLSSGDDVEARKEKGNDNIILLVEGRSQARRQSAYLFQVTG